MGIGIAHRPESTIRHLVMRPKAPLPRGESTNVIYRVQCNSCAVNYIGETGKRLQTRVGEHMRAVRRMDPLSLVADHCADSGHTFAFQNAEILGRGSDRVARETIEAWHTGTTSINRCVTLPTAYQALRTQLNDRKSQREHGPNVHPNIGESKADTYNTTQTRRRNSYRLG
uniref:GIY-YIG domain-containing protein n=1 Tax=Schistocephalus solidus TaxID=70667 RepID=A0A0X3Q2C9_SCHSO